MQFGGDSSMKLIRKERVMKKLLVCLMILVGLSLFTVGCATQDKGDEHPKTEHPAESEAPKDHPAH